jgi:hypothetical protein
LSSSGASDIQNSSPDVLPAPESVNRDVGRLVCERLQAIESRPAGPDEDSVLVQQMLQSEWEGRFDEETHFGVLSNEFEPVDPGKQLFHDGARDQPGVRGVGKFDDISGHPVSPADTRRKS